MEDRGHKERELVGEGDLLKKRSFENLCLSLVAPPNGQNRSAIDSWRTSDAIKEFVLDCVDCPIGLSPIATG